MTNTLAGDAHPGSDSSARRARSGGRGRGSTPKEAEIARQMMMTLNITRVKSDVNIIRAIFVSFCAVGAVRDGVLSALAARKGPGVVLGPGLASHAAWRSPFMTNTCLYSGWLGSATLLGARDIAALNASDEGRGADTAATIAVLSVPKLVQACLVFTLDERGHRTLAAGFDGSAGQAAPQNSS